MAHSQREAHSAQSVHHLAHLARLNLTPEEEQRLEREFEKIVSSVDQVERVPATLEPHTATITGVRHVTREDVVASSTLAGALLTQAPDAAEGCVRVPPVR